MSGDELYIKLTSVQSKLTRQEPKTDYTYSASLSYRDQVTPERRIGSPNMSRKGLRSSVGTLLSPPFTPQKVVNTLHLRSRRVPKSDLYTFSDGSDDEDPHIVGSSVSTESRNHRIINHNSSKTRHSTMGLHVGLDNADETDSSSVISVCESTPIVRRGTTSLVTRRHSQTISSATQNNISTTVHKTSKWKEYVSWLYISTTVLLICSTITSSFTQSLSRASDTWLKMRSKLFSSTTSSQNVFERTQTVPRRKQIVTTVTQMITTVTQVVTTVTSDTYDWCQRQRRSFPLWWSWLIPIVVLLLLLPFWVPWLWPDSTFNISHIAELHHGSDVWSRITDACVYIWSSLTATWSLLLSGTTSALYYIYLNILSFGGFLASGVVAMGTNVYSFVRLPLDYAWTSSEGLSLDALKDTAVTWGLFVYSCGASIALAFCNLIYSIFAPIFNGASQFGVLLLGMFSSSAISSRSQVPPPSATVSPPSPPPEGLLGDLLQSPELSRLLSRAVQDAQHSHVEFLVKSVVSAEIGLMRQSMDSTDSHIVESRNQIQEMKSQQKQFFEHLKQMETSLSHLQESTQNLEADDSKVQLEQLLSQVSSKIDAINEKIHSMESDQTVLASELRTCCKTAIHSEDLKTHVSAALAKLFGFDKTTFEAQDLHQHLGNYFVSEQNLEHKFDLLKQDIKTSSPDETTLHLTAQTVMSLISENLKKELNLKAEQLEQSVTLNSELLLKQTVDDAVTNKMSSYLPQKLDSLLPSVFDDRMNQVTKNVVDQTVVNVVQNYFESNKHWLKDMVSSGASVNKSNIDHIIEAALNKYDADRTGMVDHALETGGGSIVSTRCTEAYQRHQAELTILGYPIYRYSTNTPRSIIQPDRMPGTCYAFKGSQGFMVIQLAGAVAISSFSLEHIPKSLSPTNSIESAPRDFSVHGLNNPNDEGYHFGNFVYQDNDQPLQHFKVANFTPHSFKYVELKVLSNHGCLQYTCLYRFRVHGVRQF